MREILGGLVFLVVLAVVLGALERRFRARPPAPLLARRRLGDLAHWLLGGWLAKAAAAVATLCAVLMALPLVLLARIGERHPFDGFVPPLQRLPRALQLVIAILLVDLVSYWTHRLLHQRPFWRLHAIHHSTRDLDWFASARNHPLAEGVSRFFATLPIFILGVDGDILAGLVPIVGIWAIFIHSNVRWKLGFLRWVVVTPHFHRWHHSRAPEARDKNFAGLFPVWDALFGTLYLPDHLPDDFGVDDADAVPEGFLAQLMHPFRRRPRVE